jgi:ABC-type antimicrobial peptide transport system permease subunit
MEGVDRETAMQVFLPIVQEPYRRAVAVVRLANPEQSAAAVVAAFREFDKSMPVYKVQTMEHVMSDAIGRQRVSMVVLSVFGAVALLLAMIGLYGVITYGVAERTQEIGVRMALGATGTNVVSLFLRQGLLAAGGGIAVGIAVAFGLTRWLQTLLFGVTTTDSLTFAGVVALLFLVALAACYLPARRAARVDPLVALRWE